MSRLRVVPAPEAAEPDAIPGLEGQSLGEIGLSQFAPYLLNRISARWNLQLQEALRAFDLTTTQMRALAVLSVQSGITVAELSGFAITEPSTMSRTLDTLEEAGLIVRRAGAGDARVREVFLTEAGLALFRRVWPTMHALYAALFRGVDEMEFRGFLATLHKVLRNTRDLEG